MTTTYKQHAFPCTPDADGDFCVGMSLRDYFAAKAMQALITAGYKDTNLIAELSYEKADAMMKAGGYE